MKRQAGFNNADAADGSIWSSIATAVSSIGTAAVGLANKTGLQGDVKAACGAKPINLGFINQGRQQEYLKCASDYTTRLNQQNFTLASQNQQTQNQKNFMIIGIVGGSILLIGITAFLLIHHAEDLHEV